MFVEQPLTHPVDLLNSKSEKSYANLTVSVSVSVFRVINATKYIETLANSRPAAQSASSEYRPMNYLLLLLSVITLLKKMTMSAMFSSCRPSRRSTIPGQTTQWLCVITFSSHLLHLSPSGFFYAFLITFGYF